MKHYTIYFKQQVLTALDANHGNAYLTAKQFNIRRATLLAWVKKREAIFAAGSAAPPDQRLTPTQQLDYLSQQLMVSLPAKVQSAKLVETIRAISMVNDLRQVFALQEEDKVDVREKLAALLKHYADRSGFGGAPAVYAAQDEDAQDE